ASFGMSTAELPQQGETINARHSDVGEDHVKGAAIHDHQRFRRIGSHLHLVTELPDTGSQMSSDAGVVVHDEDIRHKSLAQPRGKRSVNRLPQPTSLSRWTRPPCVSTMSRTIASPRPAAPPGPCRPCTNRSKIRSRWSLGIPGPLSETTTRTVSSSATASI